MCMGHGCHRCEERKGEISTILVSLGAPMRAHAFLFLRWASSSAIFDLPTPSARRHHARGTTRMLMHMCPTPRTNAMHPFSSP